MGEVPVRAGPGRTGGMAAPRYGGRDIGPYGCLPTASTTNIRSSPGPGRISEGGTETTTTSGFAKTGSSVPAFLRKRGCGKSRNCVPVAAIRLSSLTDMMASSSVCRSTESAAPCR